MEHKAHYHSGPLNLELHKWTGMAFLFDKTSWLTLYCYPTYYLQHFILFVEYHYTHGVSYMKFFQKHMCMKYAGQYIVFVMGPPGPRNQQQSVVPRSMAQGRVFFFSPPAGSPVKASAPFNALDSPPVNECCEPRAPLFCIFPSRTFLF